jgi:protein gp37
MSRALGRVSKYEGTVEMTARGPRWTGVLKLDEEALIEPLRLKRPRLIFVNSMGDLFHEKVLAEQPEWVHQTFAVMAKASWHTFQILTKREEELAWVAREYPIPLPNVWLGVSVETRDYLVRLDALRSTPAAVRFVSFEPLLEDLGVLDLSDIHWAIIGGESGPKARPFDLAWARSIIDQCRAAGVPVFFKQAGSRPLLGGVFVKLKNRRGGDLCELPQEFRVREFPAHP